MAEDTTRLIIQVETLLKGLDKTLRGLAQVEAQLKKVASIKVGATGSTAAFDRATQSAKRLENQQRRLAIQSQELDNRQKRAEQSAERLSQAQVRLSASQERLGKASQQASTFLGLTNKQLIGMGNAARSIGQGLVTFGTIVTTAVTVPLTALGAASVDAAVRMDSLRRGLTAIVGSSTEASRQLARLGTLAKLPGIGFEEAIQGSIRLQAVGFSAKEAERNLREFANAVALTGGGREELARVTVQLGQLAAKGKVLSQDLRPIIEAAPAVGRALKEAFGTVNADDIAELTTNSREFLDILVTELEKLPRAAAGAKNLFENFRDTVFRAAAAVGEALVPALVQLAEVAGPIITGLAKVFSELPGPVQAVIVGITALIALAGPLSLIIGGLVLGLGRLVVGIVQFNAQLPATAVGLFGLATGANAATGALTVLRGALIATGVGLVGIAVQIGLAIAAYKLYNAATAETTEISQEQLDTTREQIDTLKEQAKFLDGLKTGVKRTADEQDKLREIYETLNIEAQTRVGGIDKERVNLEQLRAEIQRLLQLRLQEREQQVASIAGQLANTAATIDANEKQIASITDRITANNQLVKSLQESGRISEEGSRQLARGVETTKSAATAAQILQRETLALTEQQNALRTSTDESQKKARELAEKLRALGITSHDQIRQFLLLSQIMGSFAGNIDATVPVLERMIADLDKGADAAKRFARDLGGVDALLKQASDSSEQLAKNRQELIRSNATLAREFGRNAEEARRAFDVFIQKQPELRAAIEREAQIQGVSIEEIISKALGGAAKDRGEALRNAQERLNDALDQVQQAATEQSIAREKVKTDELLAINELRFRRELISFKQFIVERARLQREQIQGEIDRQKQIANLAAGDIERAQQRAGTTTGVEQATARADEQRALAEKTKAETKILELQQRQREVFIDTANDLSQFADDRQRRFRELSRELDEIIGKEGEAERAAISERFAEDLRTLRNEIKAAGQDLLKAQAEGDKAGAQIATATLTQLQGQVESIENAKRQLNALVELREAQEEIRKAEEAQQNLERDLTVAVEFRGVAEEDVIQKRLEGEAKVRDVIDAQRTRLEILAETLKRAGIAVPQALAEAIEKLRVQALGLSELPFVEQFRIAQKEFDRLNDARVQKIQEVERAVAHRDISELQGRIAIKAANGEYIGALQQQLELLQKIAAQSGDVGLQRQAQDAANTTAEVKNATTAVADLNTELKNAAIDEARDAFTGIGRSLIDIARGATTAKEALLDMLDRVANRLTDIAFDRLSDKIFGGLLKEPQLPPVGGVGGTVATGVTGAAGGAGATAAGAALQTGATAASAALTTGGTAAGAAMTTGGSTAGIAITTGGTTAAGSIIGAGASFFGTVVAAGAAFAAAVTAAAGAQAIGGVGSALAGAAAAGDIVPAMAGGRVIRVAEGGFPEAVLTTDPKFASRQFAILREYLRQTRGLFGRIPEFAAGGMVSARDMEVGLLSSLNSSRLRVPSMAGAELQPAGTSVSLRNINLIDRGQMVGGHLRSAEGARDILNIISTERDEVKRRVGIR